MKRKIRSLKCGDKFWFQIGGFRRERPESKSCPYEYNEKVFYGEVVNVERSWWDWDKIKRCYYDDEHYDVHVRTKDGEWVLPGARPDNVVNVYSKPDQLVHDLLEKYISSDVSDEDLMKITKKFIKDRKEKA